MPFFFGKTMAERALAINEKVNWMQRERKEAEAVRKAQDAYDFFCQQNGGLAYLASFIPGSEAFKARRLLSAAVDNLSGILIKEISQKEEDSFTFARRPALSLSLRGPILGAILSLPFKAFADTHAEHVHKYDKNKKYPWGRIFSSFPIIADIAEEGSLRRRDKLTNLIHTLFNPVRLVEQSLEFLHKAVNRLIEMGATETPDRKAGPGRKFAKGLVAALFVIVSVPVKIVSAITDIPYQVVKNGVYEPLKFIATALKKNDNKVDGAILKEDEADKVKEWTQDMGLQNTTSRVMANARFHESSDDDMDAYSTPDMASRYYGNHTDFRSVSTIDLGTHAENEEGFQPLGIKGQQFFKSSPNNVKMVKELAKVARKGLTEDGAEEEAVRAVKRRYQPGSRSSNSE